MEKWKDLREIGEAYHEKRQKVLYRLKLLEEELLTSTEEEAIQNLEVQIKLLRSIERDMREIGREAKNYYEKGWWRSEHYTFNARKPRNYIFTIRHD
ncbi:hypothetical protein [Vallitalea okinawensis]|uniref:hypothetical protein n=1 Tax=Vallitalea okinawensis TaxID=2078660 RepID=UPI001300619D|nr:hypothetical protein [Vallitalea okinawensis]